MQHDFIDKVFNFTAEKALFSAPCHVLVGLSGGADSMALLHALLHWPVPGLRISAVHIHHGLRGEEADRDEAFVRDYCSQRSISLTVVHTDVAAVAKELGVSLEEAGRRVRYERFESVRVAVGADYVLTAHTASDQAETVLMHMVRGCGVAGLAGIPCARERICRPLLCCHRQEVEEYCSAYDVPFVTDTTNFDTRFARNDVRHRLMPLLREMNPSIENSLLRLSKCALEESVYLDELAYSALDQGGCEFGYQADGFLLQPTVIRRRMIRLLLREKAISTIQEPHILAAEQVLLSGNGSVDLPGDFVFSVQQGVVSVRERMEHGVFSPISLDTFPCKIAVAEQIYVFEVCQQKPPNVHNLLLNDGIDYDKIQGKLCLRCRQNGDYFHPAGRGVGKSLKKWMNEWHIPAHTRDGYPVLCDDSGVIAVLGYACDERVRTTEDTKHFLVCKTGAEIG